MENNLSLFAEMPGHKTVEERISHLRDLIRKYDHFYYTEAQPLVSDREYDATFKELQELEKSHPGLITQDSPTQRIGGEALKEFKTVVHDKPMLSLANTYSVEEVTDFDRRVSEGLENKPFQYYAELKFDGVALSLRYNKGRLTVAATRGDGLSGDDVTQNVKTIKSIPLVVNEVLVDDKKLENFEVRGEVFMLEQDFLKINEQRAEQ